MTDFLSTQSAVIDRMQSIIQILATEYAHLVTSLDGHALPDSFRDEVTEKSEEVIGSLKVELDEIHHLINGMVKP